VLIAARQNKISKAYNEITTKGYHVMDVEARINRIKNLKRVLEFITY
jgi:hypothetical protein